VRAIRIVLAIVSDEVRLLGWLVLRRVPVVDAPENAHPAAVALKVDVFDLFADDLLGIERTYIAPAVEEDFEIVMEKVVLRIAAGPGVRNRVR
jgi:hypothetical protein